MTEAERTELQQLRTEVHEGFAEIRGVLERSSNREQDAHTAIYVAMKDGTDTLDQRLQKVERVAYVACLGAGVAMAIGAGVASRIFG